MIAVYTVFPDIVCDLEAATAAPVNVVKPIPALEDTGMKYAATAGFLYNGGYGIAVFSNDVEEIKEAVYNIRRRLDEEKWVYTELKN